MATEVVKVVLPAPVVVVVRPPEPPTVVRVVVPGPQGVPGGQGEPGEIGPKGDSPSVSAYDAAQVSVVAGEIVLDLAQATTFLVALNTSATAVTLLNIPAGRSQRIAIYFVQDNVGSRSVTGWPDEALWPQGNEPFLSTAANSIDLVVLDAVNGLIFGALVALDYR